MQHQCSFAQFLKYKPFWVVLASKKKVVRHSFLFTRTDVAVLQLSCVCVHHHKVALLENALRTARQKSDLHNSKSPATGVCRYNARSCSCKCDVCDDVSDLADQSLRRRAVCPHDTYLPKLICVLGKCDNCSIDRAFCPTELRRGDTTVIKYSKMSLVGEVVPGKGKETRKWKEVKVSTAFSGSPESLVGTIKNLFPFYLMHDYLHRRIGEAYQECIRRISASDDVTELWCFDYIENFSCFTQLELQQDHYSHSQVTIFVIFVMRKRREGEELQGGASFTLPANLAGEAHAFFSEDRLHDAGYAQLCLEMLMQKRVDEGLLATRYYFWSDGGPAHFKMYRQLYFIAQLSERFGTHIIWCFFQSCHGWFPPPS